MNAVQYNQQKYPPAPALKVRISAPFEPTRTDLLPALIDTGGDFTLVPLSWLLQINAPEVRWAYLRGLWGERRQVTLYLVDLHLDTGVLAGIEVIGADDDEEPVEDREVILGRNVLNKLILLLDGPNEQTDILERRPLRF